MKRYEPFGTDLHECLRCGCKQRPDQARWGTVGYIEPPETTWLCANPGCDAMWSCDVVRLDPGSGAYLFHPSQLPQPDPPGSEERRIRERREWGNL